jgi:hypothetical protein
MIVVGAHAALPRSFATLSFLTFPSTPSYRISTSSSESASPVLAANIRIVGWSTLTHIAGEIASPPSSRKSEL